MKNQGEKSTNFDGSSTRKTLVERASQVTIRDPEAHTRHQAAELDKSAKSSFASKKHRLDQIERDQKDMKFIDDEILRIKERSEFIILISPST